jgi:hypothetical protein
MQLKDPPKHPLEVCLDSTWATEGQAPPEVHVLIERGEPSDTQPGR